LSKKTEFVTFINIKIMIIHFVNVLMDILFIVKDHIEIILIKVLHQLLIQIKIMTVNAFRKSLGTNSGNFNFPLDKHLE